ncbi:hypothetical protein BpHYR1_026409 [Brachionus plicatilis]|uniref:Uncharacterized protein n=1 Tax=Brachionus plicatilis TaxID=10195 RepID=A0A3M7PIH3_BRAPC|nr:hypothetical protein BpHYR1_026409 [Brachionus plicatilis]
MFMSIFQSQIALINAALYAFLMKRGLIDKLKNKKSDLQITLSFINNYIIGSLNEVSKNNSLLDNFADLEILDEEYGKRLVDFSKMNSKTGLNQRAIKAHFKINKRTYVSRYCVSKCEKT